MPGQSPTTRSKSRAPANRGCFDGADSVQWLLRYPAPLLLCIVDKSAARLMVYQLTARFQAAVLTDLPARLALVPGQPGDGRVRIGWDADGKLALGAPILEFTISELLDDERFSLFGEILCFWVLNDMGNIRRQQMGTRSASGPSRYKTNEIPPGATGTFSMVLVPPDARTAAEATAADHLDWLARVMLTDGDRLGALLAALLLRHLIPQSDLRTPGKPAPEDLYMRLREDGRLDAAAGTAAASNRPCRSISSSPSCRKPVRETPAARPHRSAPPRRYGPRGAADRTVHCGHASRSYALGRNRVRP